MSFQRNPARPTNKDRTDKSFDPKIDAPMTMDGAMDDETRAIEKIRKERKPFGSLEGRLFWPPRHGHHMHWFNDEPGRVQQAIHAAYSHVLDAKGQPVARITGRGSSGSGRLSYLMEIPETFWKEDIENNQKKVDEVASQIYTGKINASSGDFRYIPPNGINIRQTQASR